MTRKRQITLRALGHIEKHFDENPQDTDNLVGDAVKQATEDFNLSNDEIVALHTEVVAVMEKADDTSTDLSEFNVSQSGVCTKCDEVVLATQHGFALYADKETDEVICTYCQAELLLGNSDSVGYKKLYDSLTEYGRVLLRERLQLN